MCRSRLGIVAAFAVLFWSVSVVRADFDYPDFASPVTGLTLAGDSTFTSTGAAIDLTINSPDQAGAVWRSTPEDISANFTVTFEYGVFNGPGADGMAFVIQNVDSNQITTGMGGWLGYNGIPDAVAVELDMYGNSTFGDPNGNHISIHRNGSALGGGEVATTTSIGALNSGTHIVTIEYFSGVLNVYFDNSFAPVVSAPLDLATELGSNTAFIGFTAATGGLFHTHRLLSWSYSGGSAGPQFTRGDCDAGGSLAIADVFVLLSHLFSPGPVSPLECEDACDANDDGELTLPDAISLLGALFVPSAPLLPAPMSCDVDPTDDALDCLPSSGCP